MAVLRRLSRDAGQSLVEYALILALIALVATLTIQSVGAGVAAIFDDASSALSPTAGNNGNGHGAGGNGNGNNGNGNGNGGPNGGGNPGGGNPGGGNPGGGGGGGKPKAGS
jgi:Flp pilus assembly pilin Flp